jgi:hypothetical protein
MSDFKISREALAEIERAFVEYREEFANLEHDGVVSSDTEHAHVGCAGVFLRWLKGEVQIREIIRKPGRL